MLVGRAGHLDQDLTSADGLDDRLGRTGPVDPALHDRADDFELARGRVRGTALDAVLDLETATQIQTEFGLGRLQPGVGVAELEEFGSAAGTVGPGHEVDK